MKKLLLVLMILASYLFADNVMNYICCFYKSKRPDGVVINHNIKNINNIIVLNLHKSYFSISRKKYNLLVSKNDKKFYENKKNKIFAGIEKLSNNNLLLIFEDTDYFKLYFICVPKNTLKK